MSITIKQMKTMLAHALVGSGANESENAKTDVHVVSAVALSASEKSELVSMSEKAAKGSVTMTYIVNPQVLGGFRVEIGDWVFDATLRYKLAQLHNYLVE